MYMVDEPVNTTFPGSAATTLMGAAAVPFATNAIATSDHVLLHMTISAPGRALVAACLSASALQTSMAAGKLAENDRARSPTATSALLSLSQRRHAAANL